MEWLEMTLFRAAMDEEELEQFKKFGEILMRQWKARDVGTLLEMTKLQWEQAAVEATGEQGKKGLVRMCLKYLGTNGDPHVPPVEEPSEAIRNATAVMEKQVIFGRQGKTGAHSAESNFPEAMRPSSRAPNVLSAEDLVFPRALEVWLQQKCALFDERHKMTHAETMEITHVVGDWIVTMFGTSPVCATSQHSTLVYRLHCHWPNSYVS